MFTTKKIALVSVINDLVTDNRVNKTCLTLLDCGFDVVLIGRKLPNSLPIPLWPFKSIRMHLLFLKGPFFYLFFNLRLFFKLLFTKVDLLYANDLDTLLPNYLISKIKKVPLIYDSHELFCEVPELLKTPLKRKIWLWLEKKIVPKLKVGITVSDSIAEVLEKKYNIKFNVIRNISNAYENLHPRSKKELNLPENKKIILMQGAGINIDRGAEELIDAMQFVDGAFLLIIGSGDVWALLEEKVKAQNLQEKIALISKIPKSELIHYTHHADLGLSIDKNTNLNYYYSLPNKVFDYIQSGTPILASRLPEIEKIITQFKLGDFVDDHSPQTIAKKINSLLSSPAILAEYKMNAHFASKELSWSKEQLKLVSIIKSLV